MRGIFAAFRVFSIFPFLSPHPPLRGTFPPQGEGMECVAKLNDKLEFEWQ